MAGFGNRQPHLPNVERNRPPQNTFLLSRGIYRPPSNNPPRDTEVTCSAHLQTYGSVFFVLCSLYFIVCVFRSLFIVFHCIVHCHCPVRLFSFLYGTSIKARGFAWFVDAKASSAYPRNKEEEFLSGKERCFL